uniref:Transmembrane protein n=1 Tax=Davidia involucrata TaxID=16924 RepID=A0A5B7BV73_DAVIN
MATTSVSLSPPPFTSILNPKPFKTHNLSPSISSSLAFPAILSSRRTIHFYNPPHEILPKTNQIWRVSAVSGDDLPSEANPVEISQQTVSTGDDGVYTIISVLLFVAFIALSVVTIGVIYIGVTDFLQKREREKFEKEEAAKKKKGGKKGRAVRARAGPRGFGQKIEEDDDD